MKKIKLLYLINSLRVGGTEKRVVELLRRLPREKFDPYLCCLVETGFLEQKVREVGVPIFVLGYSGIRINGKIKPLKLFQFPGLFLRLHKFLKKEKFDLMHTFLPISNTIGCTAGRLAGVTHIIASRVFTGEYRNINPLYQPLENFAGRKADIIICNARAVYDDVLKRENVNPDKLRIIHNGIEVERFEGVSAREKVRKEFDIPSKSPLVGVVAILRKHKGLDVFLDSAKIVSDEIPETHFLIVGRDDGMLEKLKGQARNLKIESKIHFAGFREDIPEILSSVDLLVSSSYEEGFSNSLLEGMAAKRAIVATNAAGSAEAIQDGETGFIVPIKNPSALAEKIILLLKDSALREKMGLAGYQRVKNLFSIDKMISSYISLYESLFNDSEK